MMPKESRRRGRVVRGAAMGVVGIALLVLAATAWGPLANSSGTSPRSQATSSTAAVPGGSVAPGPPSASLPSSLPSSAAPASTPNPSPIAARLQQALDGMRAKLSIPGVSVAILWDDGRTWVGASGMRNVAAGDPMTPGTAFAFASISKTFTAAVVLQLVQEGRLALDNSVAPLLPQYKLDPRITLRMLLDHTSGLPDYFFGKGIDAALQADPNASWTALQSWRYVPSPHATPGRTWLYSNTNYLLLGELVTAVTGHPLAAEVRTRLLDPLGLTGTYYQAVEAPREAGTLGYLMLATSNGKWRVEPVAAASDVMPFRSVVTAAGGAGSMAGTALDAARWMRAWAGGQVLSATMQAQMLADIARTVMLHAAIPYGLGIQRVTLNGYTAYGHSGRYLGMRDVARYLPQAGMTIVVLTNESAFDPNRIASGLLNVVLPSPTPSPTGSTIPGASSSAGPSTSPAPSPSPS